MQYRLLAINIDGTLLRSNGRIQSATKEAIEFVRKKEVYVTLVTNRNFQSAKKIAKALKLDTHIITHNGAFIGQSIDKPIYQSRLSEEKTFNLVQVLENFDCNIRLVHERFSIGTKMKVPGNMVAKAVLGTGEPLFYPMQFVESLGDYLLDHPVAPPKVEAFFLTEEECNRAKETIADAFDDIAVTSGDKMRLEIMPKGVSKLSGLQILGKQVGVPLSKTVVIGDSDDDIPMIEAAGLGVAMWNSSKEVKKAANWITRSNDQNGVAYMIKEHFRMQQRMNFIRNMKIEK
ncbi:HAD family phosphatase [Bacillus luteolus]|uniref:HAD family phosphatase n=1 Tax=Litchfieldia luteola TaxID=682179 RepID=A0ABR9QE51_9BACI|nr:Cof-type HAD-IIB family hydrolase [Cytobacillus luteolus]MBE4906772.1 HAD family phosphatase [Cytobacillus luteolus]MBP1940577.1 Cof subfamily protein (haloacid dehalogenase superfamily) [Cytobacillus luteolus]